MYYVTLSGDNVKLLISYTFIGTYITIITKPVYST